MKKRFSVMFLSALVFCFTANVSAFAPAADIQTFDDGRAFSVGAYKSVLMAREMPYGVLLPAGYDEIKNKDRVYPVMYLLHGLTGNHRNWGNSTSLKSTEYASDFIFVMPEGANGWYSDSISVPADKYESYIIKELIPLVESKYRVSKERNGRAIAGLSMGGYGALKFGIKYPDMFVLAGSFSGALQATMFDDKTLPGFKVLSDSIMSTFGPLDSDVRKSNDIYKLIENAKDDDLKKLPFLYIDCGTEDTLITHNQEFSKLLLTKKVPHEFRQLPGGHNWKYWNTQIEQFLFSAIQQKRIESAK